MNIKIRKGAKKRVIKKSQCGAHTWNAHVWINVSVRRLSPIIIRICGQCVEKWMNEAARAQLRTQLELFMAVHVPLLNLLCYNFSNEFVRDIVVKQLSTCKCDTVFEIFWNTHTHSNYTCIERARTLLIIIDRHSEKQNQKKWTIFRVSRTHNTHHRTLFAIIHVYIWFASR